MSYVFTDQDHDHCGVPSSQNALGLRLQHVCAAEVMRALAAGAGDGLNKICADRTELVFRGRVGHFLYVLCATSRPLNLWKMRKSA